MDPPATATDPPQEHRRPGTLARLGRWVRTLVLLQALLSLRGEAVVERRRRRRRLVVRAPVMAGAGFIAGIFPSLVYVEGVGFPVVYALFGALLAWVAGRMESRLRRFLGPGRLGGATSLPSDVVTGALFMAPFGIEGALAGALFLPMAFFPGDLFAGDTLHDAARTLSEGGGARGPDYSREDELARRGRVDEAVRVYEARSRERDDHADPLLHAAWLLRDNGRLDEAMEMLRRAVRTPGMDGRRASSITWQMAELAVELRDVGAVMPDLEYLLDRWEKEHDVRWARKQLEVLREALTLPPPPPAARTPR